MMLNTSIAKLYSYAFSFSASYRTLKLCFKFHIIVQKQNVIKLARGCWNCPRVAGFFYELAYLEHSDVILRKRFLHFSRKRQYESATFFLSGFRVKHLFIATCLEKHCTGPLSWNKVIIEYHRIRGFFNLLCWQQDWNQCFSTWL